MGERIFELLLVKNEIPYVNLFPNELKRCFIFLIEDGLRIIRNVSKYNMYTFSKAFLVLKNFCYFAVNGWMLKNTFQIICRSSDRLTCQQKLASFVWASSSFIHCLAALDFGACVEQPFGCPIVQNCQAVLRSMDWTLEDDMVDGLLFCATLTGRRGGHTPFVQAGAEKSDTGAEVVKPDPGSSWEGHSGCVCTGVWN